MKYVADVLNDVILLVDKQFQVVDAFSVKGRTEHECDLAVAFYTYRGLVTPPGYCCICAIPLDEWRTQCASPGGYHAFAEAGDADLPDLHKVEFTSLPVQAITYDDLVFYVENDNLFPALEIQQTLAV